MPNTYPTADWRKAQKMTQQDFATEIGVGLWTVKAIETARRKPSPELAKRIADRTNIPLHQLRPDIFEAAQ